MDLDYSPPSGRGSVPDSFQRLRRHGLFVFATVVACAAAAYSFSASRPATYRAAAAVAYTDQSQDLSILGNFAVRSTEPDQLAAAKADTLVRPELLAAVRRNLKISLSDEALAKRFNVRVEPTSNLVLIGASAPRAREAAGLANALGKQAVASAGREARDRYRLAAAGIRRRLNQLPRGGTANVTRAGLQEQLLRLESLGALAAPAELTKAAEVPSSPSSPKPVRNGIIGAFFGLLLGPIFVLLRVSLDRRLHDPADIADELDLPVLAKVEADALGHVVGSNGGPDDPQGHTLEVFRILRSNLSALTTDPGFAIVAVTSAVPEEGKTTVASSLAWASAAVGRRTLLVDCDLRRPTLADRLKLSPPSGLADYLAGDASFTEVVQSVSLVERPSQNGANVNAQSTNFNAAPFECITAGSHTARPAELLASARFRDLLAEARASYDLVVLDTAPLLPVADTLELVPLVDGVLLCVRANRTTREQALAGKSALDQFPPRPTGLVVTGVAKKDLLGYGYYGYASY